MAFRNLITGHVNNAFDLIGDLAEDIIFTNNTVGTYDFSTGEQPSLEADEKSVRGVISKMSRDVEDNSLILAEVIFKRDDFNAADVDSDAYDIVRFRSKDWNVYNIDDNGFTINLTASRKV